MTGNPLLTALEAFVDEVVDVGPSCRRGDDPLRAKLDVLERIIELMRIQAGWNTRRVLVRDLMNAGISVERDLLGNARLYVGRGPEVPIREWPAPTERKQSELHVPLLLYMLEHRRVGTRIGELLVDFVNTIRHHLSPADVETTETGVTRIMTTTRVAARTLRKHGLLTESSRVAYRTWELSVFGILAAFRLREWDFKLELPSRSMRYSEETGPHGASDLLAEPLSKVVQELSDPAEVVATFQRICRPKIDVVESFRLALEAVSLFYERRGTTGKGERPSLAELREEAQAVMKAVAEVVPPEMLADDIAKQLARKGYELTPPDVVAAQESRLRSGVTRSRGQL